MISDKMVQFHRRASMALDFFSPTDQERIKRSVARLDSRSDGSGRVRAWRISSREPLYVMRISREILGIFRKTPDGIVVEDIVRRGTLNSFAKGDSVAGALQANRPRLKRKPVRGIQASER